MSKYTIDDKLLYENLGNLEEKILASLPKEKDLSHKFSRNFNKKINKLIKESNRSQGMNLFIKYSKNVAAIILIVVSILFATTMSIEAYRVRVFKIITRVFNEYTQIDTEGDGGVTDFTIIVNAPKYIAKGFKQFEVDESDFNYRAFYKNKAEEEIFFNQNILGSGQVLFDTEGTTVKTKKIKNQEINYFTNKGVSQLYWNDDTYFYILSSTTDIDELFKMAESVIKNK